MNRKKVCRDQHYQHPQHGAVARCRRVVGRPQSGGGVMTTGRHDAVDSLIYLDRAMPLDWLDEQLSEYFADTDGNIPEGSIEADFIAAIVTARESIREEVNHHRDGRKRFSTGVPFERIERYPSTEPDADGKDVPVIATAHVQLHPSGTPTEPVCGGIWEDEVAS